MDLNDKVKILESALNRLTEAYKKTNENINNELYVYFRDSPIQRFEFTVEILWKTLKLFLR